MTESGRWPAAYAVRRKVRSSLIGNPSGGFEDQQRLAWSDERALFADDFANNSARRSGDDEFGLHGFENDKPVAGLDALPRFHSNVPHTASQRRGDGLTPVGDARPIEERS